MSEIETEVKKNNLEPRFIRKQKDPFVELYNKLFKEFQAFESKHVLVNEERQLVVPQLVYDEINALDEQWRWLVRAQLKKRDNVLDVDIHHFKKMCMKSILAHQKILYVEDITNVLNAEDITPNVSLIMKGYEDKWEHLDHKIQNSLNQIFMHVVEIPSLKQKYNFPSTIEELSPEQYVDFVGLVCLLQSKMIDVEEFLQQLLVKLLKIKLTGKFQILKEEEKEEVYANLILMADRLESFFVASPFDSAQGPKLGDRVVKSLDLNFIKNPLPKLGRLWGPEDALTDISFGEYMNAHTAYVDFAQTQNVESLRKLVAVLYRKKRLFGWFCKLLPNYDGRSRRKFNANTIDRRAVKLKLSYVAMYGVFLFFNGCENFLRSGEPSINGHRIDLKILYSDNKTEDASTESASGNIGLVGLLYALAETKVFGNIKETNETNLYDILARLYQVRCQAIEAEKEMKKHATS